MTSQIFLFNQRGVVVASDTLSCRRLAPTGWARFPSNSKIFPLTEGHRVVVTTSGQATIAKIHDELLLREWIASLSEPLASLDAYVNDFTRWASATLHSLEFDDLENILDVVNDELSDIFRITPIRKLIAKHRQGETNGEDSEAEIMALLKKYAEDNFRSNYYEDLNPEKMLARLKRHKKTLIKQFGEYAGEPHRRFSDHFRAEWLEFLSQLLSRWVPSRSGETTLNFAGFGSEELFGGRVQLDIRGFYAGRLRFQTHDRNPDSTDLTPAIRTHAQTTAMDAFLNGIDDCFRHSLPHAAEALMEEIHGISVEDRDRFCTEFAEAVDGMVAQHFNAPLMRALYAMSINEMTHLADLLIELQKMRAQMSDSGATVGGLVEVVSITRHQGLTWHRMISPLQLVVGR